MGKDQRTGRRAIWGRVASMWHHTDRARAIAQIPVVALSPAVGPVADQVRLAQPQDLITMRREADLEQQKQWADHELHQIEGRPAYMVRDNDREADPGTRAARDRTAHERDR